MSKALQFGGARLAKQIPRAVLVAAVSLSLANLVRGATPTNQFLTPFPAPNGPYGVGVVSRLLTDSSRENRYTKTNGSFMASVWYPGQIKPGVSPGPYADPKIAARGASDCIAAHSQSVRAHALPGDLVATNEAKYPLVIYSHGHQLTRTDNTRKIENLVSWGFIVAAFDSVDCFATVLRDGQLFRGVQAPNLGPGDPTTLVIATNRLQDVRFLLDEAALWNAADPVLGNRLGPQAGRYLWPFLRWGNELHGMRARAARQSWAEPRRRLACHALRDLRSPLRDFIGRR